MAMGIRERDYIIDVGPVTAEPHNEIDTTHVKVRDKWLEFDPVEELQIGEPEIPVNAKAVLVENLSKGMNIYGYGRLKEDPYYLPEELVWLYFEANWGCELFWDDKVSIIE